MTEYEAYDLVLSFIAQTNALVFGYFSILSGFLIMSYFLANKLSLGHSLYVIILFSLAFLYVLFNLYALSIDFDNLIADMLTKKATGEYDLEWFGENPPWLARTTTYVLIIGGVGGYLGALIFFFHRRKDKT